jgi:hypothetical protein
MLQLSAFWPDLSALQAASLPVVWGWASPLWVPRGTELRKFLNLQDWELPQQASYKRCSHSQELQCRKNLLATTQGSAGKTFFSKYKTPDQSFATAVHSSDQQHQQQPSTKAATVFRKTICITTQIKSRVSKFRLKM